MSTVKDTYRRAYLLIALGLILVPSLSQAQESYWSVTQSASVEIVPLNASVQNDSVTLHWKILVSDIRVRRNHSHVLVPLLTGVNNSLSLPRVIISGRKRASYDTRERTLDPFQRKPYSVSVYRHRRPVEPIYYSVTFPYATWMEHCSLELRQLSESAYHSALLSSECLCQRFSLRGGRAGQDATERNLASQDLAAIAPIDPSLVPVLALADSSQADSSHMDTSRAQRRPSSAPDTLTSTRIALFLAYPAGFSGINALFSDNAAELAKVDRLLLPLLNDPHLRIRRIRVTGYCSPDGVYTDNEQLAKKRAQEFVRYLRAAYPLSPAILVRTAWVAEDWEGLRHYLAQSTLPLRNRALSIIDHTGLFEGRERQLMDLDGGDLYRDIKQTIFPKLRRIELVVEAEEHFSATDDTDEK